MGYGKEVAISILMTLDYWLTYIGMRAGMIEEANPVMLRMMEQDISRGLPLRLLTIFIIITMIQLLRREEGYYTFVTRFALVANVSVLYLHGIWLLHGWIFGIGIFG